MCRLLLCERLYRAIATSKGLALLALLPLLLFFTQRVVQTTQCNQDITKLQSQPSHNQPSWPPIQTCANAVEFLTCDAWRDLAGEERLAAKLEHEHRQELGLRELVMLLQELPANENRNGHAEAMRQPA